MKSKFNYLYFDIYSKRASFFYKNQEKIGTYFGLFLTVVYILVSIGLFIYNLYSTLKRNNIIVYDSTMYAQQLLSININSNSFYFAFGIEEPKTLNRFIDETIYYPEIEFTDRIKVNGDFITQAKKKLDYEKCNEKNFGENYQHLFSKGELNNSYCLKNFNLTLTGGFQYEKMSYITIKIFPCKNTTENNNHCKPQKDIDYYLANGYFSILLKNFALYPSNFAFPVIPTLKDLFTTIGKKFYRYLIIKFGDTEIYTDTGLFNENQHLEKYLQFREETQTISIVDEEHYKSGKELCLVLLKLDDIIFIQKRKYTKISEIFSRIGGSMQLIYTIFSLLSLLINKFDSELKIINSIFNFDLDNKKMALKYQTLTDFDSINIPSYNKNLIFSSRKSVKSKPLMNTKNTNNNFATVSSNLSSLFRKTENRKVDDSQSSKLDLNNKSKNITICQSPNINKLRVKSRKSKFDRNKNIEEAIFKVRMNKNELPRLNFLLSKKESNKSNKSNKSNSNLKTFNDKISLNLFDYFFRRKNEQKAKHIELYNLGISFYKKRMDLIHVFTLLLITERILLKRNR